MLKLTVPTTGLHLAGDMQYGVDVAPVKSRNKSAGVRSRDRDELHAATISLLA